MYYQSYLVSYNKTENATFASASFRVRESNGARVKLSNGAAVTANGKPGAPTNPFDISIWTWQFDALEDVSFTLTKPNATLLNDVKRAEIGDISFAGHHAHLLRCRICLQRISAKDTRSKRLLKKSSGNTCSSVGVLDNQMYLRICAPSPPTAGDLYYCNTMLSEASSTCWKIHASQLLTLYQENAPSHLYFIHVL